LFTEDTTLGDTDKDLNNLINRFVNKLQVLLEWCELNKLDINWSKTYFMYVTNKRIKLSKEIVTSTKTVNSSIIDIIVSDRLRKRVKRVIHHNSMRSFDWCISCHVLIQNNFSTYFWLI